MFQEFLNGWDGAYMELDLLEMRLWSAMTLFLMGTLKSTRMTTLEAGERCLMR